MTEICTATKFLRMFARSKIPLHVLAPCDEENQWLRVDHGSCRRWLQRVRLGHSVEFEKFDRSCRIHKVFITSKKERTVSYEAS
jgi:hypothetical protein